MGPPRPADFLFLDTDFHRKCIELAIAEARRTPAENRHLHPMVAAVAAMQGTILGTAFRGETGPGEHAEYILLDRKLGMVSLAGATVYTAVEPCTTRHHAKVSCAQRLIDRRIAKVFIGMLDPNPYLAGRSILLFREAGIDTAFFPHDLGVQVEELNRTFIAASKDSMPLPKVPVSEYEWHVLESEGSVAGRTQHLWYEYFLASTDLNNLNRLLSFYKPEAAQDTDRRSFDIPAAETSHIAIATDLRLIRSMTADPTRLLSLTARQFEIFTYELLDRFGYADVRIGKGSKDGGIDVSAYIEHPLGIERVIVQCKRNAIDNKVGEPVIKQLLSDTDIHKAARGLIVTTSYLTRGARLLIESYRHRLSALDYDQLLRILRGEEPRNEK